ncbi:MAG: phosphoesterase, partial [Mesorhizobium sp.]
MKNTTSKLFNWLEFPVLLAGLVLAGGLWGFEELMEVARDTTPHAFDTEILLAFREAGQPDNPIGPLWLEGAMRDITSLGSASVLVLITAAVIVYLL